MKHPFKSCFSALLAVVLFFGLCSSLTVHSAALDAAFNPEDPYNWGTRGETATSLSASAVGFYADNAISYETLAALSGAAELTGVPDSALYIALQKLMKENHTHLTNYGETRPLYARTDCENGGGTISSFYSGAAIGPDWDKGATWNREHTWPNSKGLGGDDENDIMMLRPTAKSENYGRNNDAYGESSGYYHPNAESDGITDVRGDVTRIFLYVYVRWGNVNGNGKYDTWGTRGVMESEEILLKWMEEDPVDTWELGRNDVVQTITGTRNVFVDYPELAFLLFAEEIPADMVTPSGEAQKEDDIPEVSEKLSGDVNGDGEVTIGDLMRLANHFAKNVLIVEINSDVNGDGGVTIADLMRLANYFAGKATLA